MTETTSLAGTTVTTYTYDVANRLTVIQRPTSNVQLAWDDRGNLTHDGVFTYTYNGAGRLTRAESVTDTLAYTYTVDGLRVGQAIDGDETEFAWDWAAGLPEMLAAGDDLYLVGHDTLGKVTDGSAWSYYLPDALGSVRQAADGAGAVVSAREWTPYGVEVGQAQEGLGYAGEWADAALGMTYLRARWYNGESGIFISWDALESEPSYQYVRGNPINGVDPSGYIVEPTQVGTQFFYSCKCGWIDTSHAGPRDKLIRAVRSARLSPFPVVTIGESFADRSQDVVESFEISAGFYVFGNRVLSKRDADEVALGIHISWENFYEESGQGSHSLAEPVQPLIP